MDSIVKQLWYTEGGQNSLFLTGQCLDGERRAFQLEVVSAEGFVFFVVWSVCDSRCKHETLKIAAVPCR